MSDRSTVDQWQLPPLLFCPERQEVPSGWLHKAETLVGGWHSRLQQRFVGRSGACFVSGVNALEPAMTKLDENALGNLTDELRMQLHRDGMTHPLIMRSFALVREVARRHLQMRHFDVQLLGGLTLLQGQVAEMATGEGKTLAATLAAATAALAGRPVHMVTVNDYLAGRDASLMRPLFEALKLRVGVISNELPANRRRAAYACDITYASNKEIAFDYLRDRIAIGSRRGSVRNKLQRLQMQKSLDDRVVMRGLHFAIVDEADSALIDEARTPLIVSRQTDARAEQIWAREALQLAGALQDATDYRVLVDERRVELTEAGKERLVMLAEQRGGEWRSVVRREDAARQALAALHLFQRDEHYLVRDGKIRIIDEFTGRIMADRTWGDGLHQVIEAKEGCEVSSRNVPLARITFQRFFRRYLHLCGMSGTAREVRRELWSVYRLPIVSIATHRPVLRYTQPLQICKTTEEKWQKIVERIGQLHATGRPILVGTRSVAASQLLSARLAALGLEHVVLSAAQDEHESQIIARAGQLGQITVATNMAGRGVDIRLGADVETLGGLYVILSERHDARRIDRQLFGRCARQGDPGATEEIVSLQDPLIAQFGNAFWCWLSADDGRLGRRARAIAFFLAQRRAEREHAHARAMLLGVDRNTDVRLAFSGGTE